MMNASCRNVSHPLLAAVLGLAVLAGNDCPAMAADMPLLRVDNFNQSVNIELIAQIVDLTYQTFYAYADDGGLDENDTIAMLTGLEAIASYLGNSLEITALGTADCLVAPNSSSYAMEATALLGGWITAYSEPGYVAQPVMNASAAAQVDFEIGEGPENEQYGTMTIEFDLDSPGTALLYYGGIDLTVQRYQSATDTWEMVAEVHANCLGGVWNIGGFMPDQYGGQVISDGPIEPLFGRFYLGSYEVEAGDVYRLRTGVQEVCNDYGTDAYDGESVVALHDVSGLVAVWVDSH
ncbi:MAG: hypothetical protein SH850_02695 [Planctomycetaceae bacterium]|nr:hypothetical protein [Planctomycetaceae bacterium]